MTYRALRAGVARQTITPPTGIYQSGYGERSHGNRGVHDDLSATALVLDDGNRRLALVACDLLCLNEFIVDRVRATVGATTEVLICCSHTHSGPITDAGTRARRSDQVYVDALVARLAAAVREAESCLVPANLTHGRVEAFIAVNRRERGPDGQIVMGANPQGAVDRSVNVIAVRTPAGEPLATLVNFACHGTVLGPANLLVSADWIGAMRTRIETALGGKTLFLQGAAGDLNPTLNGVYEQGWKWVKEVGRAVGDAVISATQPGLEPLRGTPIALTRQEIWLPLDAAVTSRTPPAIYRQKLLAMAGLPTWMSFLADPLLNRRFPWHSRLEARGDCWCVPLRVNTARIGDLALVTFGSEAFTETGMAIKNASPAPLTWFASLTDGCIGYLPTAPATAEGGYEVDAAPYAYRYPARLAAACEQIAIRAAQNGLQKLWEPNG